AMSVRPGDRYSNVADLVSDLKDFAAGRNAKMARIASAELLDDSADTTTPATRRPRAFAVSVAAIAVALIAVLVLQFRKPRLSEFPNLDGRSDGVASAKTLAVGVPSEDDLDAEFHDIQQLYLEAARDLSASSSKTSAGHRTLSIETQRKLREGAKRCDRLADDVGRTEHSMMRVASLLRKIAFVFDTSGDAFQASEYYGDAAEMLEELDATRPPVFAELCWLRYLQTRRREILQGFASQAFRYAEIAEGAEDMLRTPGLEIAVQSKLHEVVGMIDLARERYRSAATHLLAVQDAEFDQEHVTMALLTAYRMSDQFEKAMPIAIKLVERSPKNHEAWRNLAGLHLHLNEVSEAMSAFQKCVDLDRSNALGWQGLAWAQYRSGEPSLAIESINEAARFSPKNDTILTTRAKFYSGQGRYDEAAADFREALTLRPSSTYVAYPAFVTLAFRSRSDSEDLEFCHDVLRRRPKHWSESMVHQLEAILAFREGRWEDADFFLRKIERPRSPFQIMQVAVDLQLETSAERIDDLKRELEDWQQIHDVTSSDSPLDHLMVRYVFGCTTERWATTDGSF
ncbi:MAG: tetratricopeptide repeat protein, partial [Planctomycetota bacterium]